VTLYILGTIVLILAFVIAVVAFFLGLGLTLSVMRLQAELRELTARIATLEGKPSKEPAAPAPRFRRPEMH
jgi:hypothetical protein